MWLARCVLWRSPAETSRAGLNPEHTQSIPVAVHSSLQEQSLPAGSAERRAGEAAGVVTVVGAYA